MTTDAIARPKIEIHNLRKTYPARGKQSPLLAVDGADFVVNDEEFVCILGPSGCGKSTILNILGGLDPSFSGDIQIEGTPLASGQRHGRRVGYVFQEPRLLPWLTVEKNIEFAMDSAGMPRNTWAATTRRVLATVGLAGFEGVHPHQLSGGMQQRAAIARAFAVEPEILLMDEPFSALDEITARGLRKSLLRIWRENRKTVIFVTHNCFEATFLADRILLMSKRPGRVYNEIKIEVPRPRDYDDPRLFELSSSIVKTFLRDIGEEM